jgi:hypothetical glycosyl hydrolase
MANDLGNSDLSYSLYRKAATIDMGMNMKSSDHGIHGASLGGVWQIIVCGFGGIRMVDGELRIEPKLPREISQIIYPVYWKGNLLEVIAKHNTLQINNKGAECVSFINSGRKYQVNSNSEIKIV